MHKLAIPAFSALLIISCGGSSGIDDAIEVVETVASGEIDGADIDIGSVEVNTDGEGIGLETDSLDIGTDGQGIDLSADGVDVSTEGTTGADVNTGTSDSTGNVLEVITGFGETVTVINEITTDLTVSGSGHTVNIESNIGILTLTGANNLLNFSPDITVETCSVTGSDNTAQTDDSLTLDCEVSGSGNIGFGEAL